MNRTMLSSPLRRTAMVLAALALLLAACGDDGGKGPAAGGTPAVASLVFREVQCLGNPWERDWQTANQGATYPSGEAEQRAIFEAYWRRIGIAVSDVTRDRYIPRASPICQGCDCPTGLEWRLRVPGDLVQLALAYGFRRQSS